MNENDKIKHEIIRLIMCIANWYILENEYNQGCLLFNWPIDYDTRLSSMTFPFFACDITRKKTFNSH